eukprot:4935615-Pyramimonas_sp.AAC.2
MDHPHFRCRTIATITIVCVISCCCCIKPCGSQHEGFSSETDVDHLRFFGNVDSDANLSAAVDVAAQHGRMVLVAVGGADHLVTALNIISQFRKFKEDSVFILTPKSEDCAFVSAQRVVAVRVCGWTNALTATTDWWETCDESQNTRTRIWHLRLLFLHRILSLKERLAVMMTDTDVCYRRNMLDVLYNSEFDIVLNGNSEAINIGMLYGKRRDGDNGAAEKFYGEVARRLTTLRVDGIKNTHITCRNKASFPPLSQNITESIPSHKCRLCVPLLSM